jgi:hypothetical protein
VARAGIAIMKSRVRADAGAPAPGILTARRVHLRARIVL